MLQEHQQGLEQQLTEASRSVSQQWSAADLIARQLRDALSSPLSANSPPGTMQAPAFAQTLRTMASGQMEELMGMAARARLQQLGLALPRPGGTPSQGGTGAPAAALVTGVFAAPADMEPAHQATLYRLPPALRQPLLQGMQERAPEGYGKLVDSYYDRLSEEMK
jgi:hypothetical protein